MHTITSDRISRKCGQFPRYLHLVRICEKKNFPFFRASKDHLHSRGAKKYKIGLVSFPFSPAFFLQHIFASFPDGEKIVEWNKRFVEVKSRRKNGQSSYELILLCLSNGQDFRWSPWCLSEWSIRSGTFRYLRHETSQRLMWPRKYWMRTRVYSTTRQGSLILYIFGKVQMIHIHVRTYPRTLWITLCDFFSV